jgi:hypothetical protein
MTVEFPTWAQSVLAYNGRQGQRGRLPDKRWVEPKSEGLTDGRSNEVLAQVLEND